MAAELKPGNGAGRGASVALTDLEKKFERVNAVDGVSLDIRSGEFLTLLGPSRVRNSPERMSSDTPSTALTRSNFFSRSVSATEAPRPAPLLDFSSAATC